MTGTGGTAVSDPQSGVHTGSGDQYIYNKVIWHVGANERLLRSGATRLTIVREHRRRLARCFVRPRFYGRATERLTHPGSVVLLDGAPGTGRRAAATMLLEELPGAGNHMEELPLEYEEDVLDTKPGNRYLLDLSGVPEAGYSAAQRVLVRYRAVVEQSRSWMVAVLPAGLDWMLHADLAPLVVMLERPRGRAVFSKHLRVRGIDFESDQLDTEDLAHLFTAAPMRELARLAELVTEARDSKRYGTSFPAWRDEAVAAATNWSKLVSRHLRDHRDVEERALLLSAAMASGAAAEAVHSGAQRLLEALEYQHDGTPRLAQADLGEQLEALEVERDDDGRVRFTRLAYDNAVRRYFWENFPDLRPTFRTWVARCMELPGLRAEDRMRLVDRFAEQALASGRPEDLCVLVQEWTQPRRMFRAEAAAVLELGLGHDQYGSFFRSRLYDWATGRISPDLARVLTDVCRQVVASTHPEQAAVRLRHLALRQSGQVAIAARTALLEVARGNRRVYSRLTDRLVSGPLGNGADDVLLGLLEPGDLRITPPWQEFVLAWRALMLGTPAAAWTPLLRRWLTAMTRDPRGAHVVKALLLAAVGDPALLNRLYVAVCEWAEGAMEDPPHGLSTSREERERVAERFCREIDRALGVDGAHSAPATHGTREGI